MGSRSKCDRWLHGKCPRVAKEQRTKFKHPAFYTKGKPCQKIKKIWKYGLKGC